MATRAFDVVVFGATGFTGRLICEHLLNHYPSGVRWAMAGRSRDKLERTKLELRKVGCTGVDDVPMILADSGDPVSLDAMTSATKTVISTVGPYSLYGDSLVESSCKNSTNYCDLTGEVPWARRMSTKYHEEAAKKGVKLVHCCGYDSLPFDMAVYLLHKRAEETGKKLDKVYTLTGESLGGVSGGTVASGFAISKMPKEDLKHMSDPYGYASDVSSWKGDDKDESWWWGYNSMAKKHTYPFVMAACNTRVVRRSNALLGGAYGSQFKYQEESAAPNLAVAVIASTLVALLKVSMALPFLQPLLKMMLPSPGEGPSRDLMMKGYWSATAYGKFEGSDEFAVAEVGGKHDPGYYDTSRMLLEAALAMSLQGEEIKAEGLPAGGVLTPATALGMVGIERLRKAGFTFEIKSG